RALPVAIRRQFARPRPGRGRSHRVASGGNGSWRSGANRQRRIGFGWRQLSTIAYKPVIALVGRANVGKSTLFNRITRSRAALVADFSGLTRDRHYGEGRVGGTPFIVVDTGGFEPVAKTGILAHMARQTQQAIAEADVVIFLVDARAGINAHDHEIAALLRKNNQRVVLAVNKAEGMR